MEEKERVNNSHDEASGVDHDQAQESGLDNEKKERNMSDQDIKDPEVHEEGQLPGHEQGPLDDLDSLQEEYTELKDKYLRLYADFENYRRRKDKERLELIKTASEDMAVALLPIIDDFERGQQAFEQQADYEAMKKGFDLIHDKLKNTLSVKGVKVIDVKKGDAFNDELHEAVTQIPAPEASLKGKIIDVIEKGYYLNDKVIRFAKVVTGG